MARSKRWVWIAVVALGCATSVDRFYSSGSTRTDWSCSRANPLMQSAVLEAVVAGGGPLLVDVAGWMCGPIAYGSARLVLLRYTPDDAPPFLVPVLFEQGELMAFGWHLLETQPHRYGPASLPDRDHPWRRPAGWSAVRLRDHALLTNPSFSPESGSLSARTRSPLSPAVVRTPRGSL